MYVICLLQFECVLTHLSSYQTGEIDILEGVHDNEHNQVTWHTGPSKFQRVLLLIVILTMFRLHAHSKCEFHWVYCSEYMRTTIRRSRCSLMNYL